MASRQMRQPFWQSWVAREPASREPVRARRDGGVQRMPPPQVVGWPERPEPSPQRPEEEVDEIIGRNASATFARSSRAFFAQAELAQATDAWLTAPAPPMPRGQRRAMYATIAITCLGTLAIGGQLIYHRVIMPVPVTLGVPLAPRLPSRSRTVARVTPQPAAAAPAPEPAPVDDPATERSLPAASATDKVPPPGPSPQALHALAPDAATSLVDLAWLNVGANDFEGAYRYAERATVADPSREDAWTALERALDGLHDPQRAQAAYRKCVSASPGPFAFACSRLLP